MLKDPAWLSQVVRGSAAAPLSQLLTVLEPLLRVVAGQGKWQVISMGSGTVEGRLECHKSLKALQDTHFQ